MHAFLIELNKNHIQFVVAVMGTIEEMKPSQEEM